MIGYRKNLDRDLKRWREKGIISADAESAIRADADARGGGFSLAPALAILGAVLLCFAAMTFVAANWQAMPKLARLGILFASLWGAYTGAWALHRSAMEYATEAAILLGLGLFGASIMLIAQMYHIEGNPPDAVLTWAAGSLLAGVLLRSRAALALTIGLVSLWSWWEVSEMRGATHWLFLAGWLAAAIPVVWLRWRAGYHLLAISLGAWIAGLGYQLDWPDPRGIEISHLAVAGIGTLAALASGLAARDPRPSVADAAEPLAIYGLGTAYAGLFALQVIEDTPGWGIALFALLSLALIVSVLVFAVRTQHTALVRIAYLLFSIEMMALYFKTLGTLLDTALFFLVAGLLVIALAMVAWRLAKAQKAARVAT